MAGPSPFLPTNLDANQAIRGAYDEQTGRFRVETEATIIDGAVEVAIDASSDNIAVKDPSSGNILSINSDGSINVNAIITPTAPGTTISIYNEVVNVAIGASQTVLTYVVPAGDILELTRIDISGDCVATFEVEFNSTTNAKRRLYYTEFNSCFNYSNQQDGYSLSSGTVIIVSAINNSKDSVASFNATLQGVIK